MASRQLKAAVAQSSISVASLFPIIDTLNNETLHILNDDNPLASDNSRMEATFLVCLCRVLQWRSTWEAASVRPSDTLTAVAQQVQLTDVTATVSTIMSQGLEIKLGVFGLMKQEPLPTNQSHCPLEVSMYVVALKVQAS